MSARILSLVVLATLSAAPARAHFLFVRILPPAEGGRAAEVYFSELAEAGDARFIDKIAATTKLWLQETPGKFEPLQARKEPDRLRAYLPSGGSLMVLGACEYGVLGRPKQTAFLLRHFPKALAGRPDELNRLAPYGKLPLEIVATIHGDEVRLTALVDGKPLPRAEFETADARLKGTKFTANDKGEAVWKPAPGFHAIYTHNTRKEAGERDGKKYTEIRDFATVSFAWPLERKDADSKAVALFEEAVAARAAWRDFPGFEAKVAGNLAGRKFDGSVAIDAKGQVTFSDRDPSRQESVSGWVEDQLSSIVLHRLARTPSADRPKPVLRFAEAGPENPLGPLLIFDGGKFASSYRVKDKQIMVVNRNLGKESMTITVLENDRTKDGKFLPRHFQVQYWDAATGRLLRTETTQNRWERVGALDLPSLIQVTTSSDAGLVVRTLSLGGHALYGGKK